MYDTISLISPFLKEYQTDRIKKYLIMKKAYNIDDGDIIYEFIQGSLQGSYDNRISIILKDTKVLNGVNVSTEPYIVVECSIHKLMMGHNVYGGPKNIKYCCMTLISFLENYFEIDLPEYLNWEVRRIDVANIFILPSLDAVKYWFTGINSTTFPRRNIARYGNQAINISGSSTTVKMYSKGCEFRKHDRAVLRQYIDEYKLEYLQDIADRILRIEVEVHLKKFKYDFKHIPKVSELDDMYFNNIFDIEVNKVLKVCEKMYCIVNRMEDVRERLYKVYKPSMAGLLLSTWCQLSTLGEDKTKLYMKKATYYKHRKLLKESGCSWLNTDIILKENNIIPYGFAPIRGNMYHMDIELPVNMFVAIA